eukprot:2141657-Pyramimonas_sp.AAC.1
MPCRSCARRPLRLRVPRPSAPSKSASSPDVHILREEPLARAVRLQLLSRRGCARQGMGVA